jgi:opacity protein-like surface antigen
VRLLTGMVVAALGVASPAAAQGLYGSLLVGGSFLQKSSNVDEVPALIPTDVDLKYKDGPMFGGALGYAFPFGLRVEGEVSYRRNSISRVDINRDGGLGFILGGPPLDGTSFKADGKETSLSFLANAWYDIKTGTRFTPYVGGGIGVTWLRIDNLRIGSFTLADDSEYTGAWQVGGGVSVELTPSISLSVDYRYFGAISPVFKDFAGFNLDSEYRAHNVVGGIRITF